MYGDAYEKWFSSEWFVPKINKGQKQSEPKYTFERQIHPGMGAHISMLWVTAYNLVHLASEYCSMPSIKFQNNITSYDGSSWNLPELKKDFKEPIGKPKQQPNVIPPLLTKDLLLEDMTKLWRGALSNYQSDQLQQSYSVCSAKTNTQQGNYTNHQVICPFSWVSGLSLQQNNVTWIEDYFRSRSSVWENWKLSTDGDKIGFVPTPATKKDTEDIDFSQEFILNFSYSQTIRSITIFFMKSYGSKWVNSELSTKIWLTSSSSPNRQLLEERRMAGTHNKNTSEMYTEEIILQEPINANENFQIDASLVGGTTFKIMGIAVCS